MLISILTLSALAVEFALAFLLWFRPSRKWIAVVGVMLHAGIVPLVNVPLFGEQMSALYLVFLAPDELDRFLGLLDPRAWFSRRRSEWKALSAQLDPVASVAGLASARAGVRGRRAGTLIVAVSRV